MIIIGDKEAVDRYSYYLKEREWKRATLDNIEPGMSQQRIEELKISMKVMLLDEQYRIMMDGMPVGEPFPMPEDMLHAIMWGKQPMDDKKKDI